jgi:L-amino acid N-acyltransferase YncA
MVRHFDQISPDDAIEILNGFTNPNTQRGGGVGKALFNAIADEGRRLGKKYLVSNSGPRWQANWGFHDKMFDERAGFLKDKYGSGADAMTFIKYLENN